jgi:uncharacterized membrane protein
MAKARQGQKAPGEYAKEALAEWRKAAGYGVAALSAARARKTGEGAAKKAGGKGRPAGTAADALLSKLGAPGKAASKLALGSRLVERITPDGLPSFSRNGNGHHPPIPIQESIEVAVPVKTAYELTTNVEDYPEYLDRVEAVEPSGKGAVTFELHYRGRTHHVEVELVDERPEERIEWRTVAGPQCTGIVSFHRLAPRLTHIELSVELDSEGLLDRVTRATHLTERAIRTELQRFKAHAELAADYDEDDFEEEEEPEEEPDEEPQAYEDDEYEDEYDDDLEEGDQAPEGEAYVEETAHGEHHEAYEEVGR